MNISLLLEKIDRETDIDKIAYLFKSINHNSSWGNNWFLHNLCREMNVTRLIDFLNKESDLERTGYYIDIFGKSTDYFVLEMFRSLDKDLLIKKIDSEKDVDKIMLLIDYIQFSSTIGDKSIFQEKKYEDLKKYEEFYFDEFLLRNINLNRIIDKLIKKEYSVSLTEEWGVFFQDYRFLLSDLIVAEKIEWINETFGSVMDLTEYDHSDYESI